MKFNSFDYSNCCLTTYIQCLYTDFINLSTDERVYHRTESILFQEGIVEEYDYCVIGPTLKLEANRVYDIATATTAVVLSASSYEVPIPLASKQ